MVIDLTALEEGKGPWSKQAEPEKIELAYPEYEFSDPVSVRLQINRSEDQYIIRGRVATRAHTRCVKCLEAFELSVDEEIGWVVQVASDSKMLAEEEELEDFWFIQKGESQLDITSRVREMVLVSLPDHPTCREDCRGLCPHCGKNLNAGPCDCRNNEPDHRWAQLKDLVRGKRDSSGR